MLWLAPAGLRGGAKLEAHHRSRQPQSFSLLPSVFWDFGSLYRKALRRPWCRLLRQRQTQQVRRCGVTVCLRLRSRQQFLHASWFRSETNAPDNAALLLSRAAESSGVPLLEGCCMQYCPFCRACVVKQSKLVFAKPPFLPLRMDRSSVRHLHTPGPLAVYWARSTSGSICGKGGQLFANATDLTSDQPSNLQEP